MIVRSFQGINRLFPLSLENSTDKTVHTKNYLPTVEIKNYNIMIGGKSFLYWSVKNNLKTFDNIRKIAIGQEYDNATGCALHYKYFNNYYSNRFGIELVAIDLSKQQALNSNSKTIQQITLRGNINQG